MVRQLALFGREANQIAPLVPRCSKWPELQPECTFLSGPPGPRRFLLRAPSESHIRLEVTTPGPSQTARRREKTGVQRRQPRAPATAAGRLFPETATVYSLATRHRKRLCPQHPISRRRMHKKYQIGKTAAGNMLSRRLRVSENV